MVVAAHVAHVRFTRPVARSDYNTNNAATDSVCGSQVKVSATPCVYLAELSTKCQQLLLVFFFFFLFYYFLIIFNATTWLSAPHLLPLLHIFIALPASFLILLCMDFI